MPVLGPNQYLKALARLDDRLNAANGIGLRRVVRAASELSHAVKTAQREAEAAFGELIGHARARDARAANA